MAQTTHPKPRRVALRQIGLPMFGVGLVVLAAIIIVLVLPRRSQVSIIADWLLTLMLLLPTVLCLFGMFIGLVALIAALNRLHHATAKPLGRVNALSRTLADRAAQTADSVNQRAIGLGARFAFVDRLLSTFDAPSTEMKDEEPHD
jgi:hypothetical protein